MCLKSFRYGIHMLTFVMDMFFGHRNFYNECPYSASPGIEKMLVIIVYISHKYIVQGTNGNDDHLMLVGPWVDSVVHNRKRWNLLFMTFSFRNMPPSAREANSLTCWVWVCMSSEHSDNASIVNFATVKNLYNYSWSPKSIRSHPLHVDDR